MSSVSTPIPTKAHKGICYFVPCRPLDVLQHGEQWFRHNVLTEPIAKGRTAGIYPTAPGRVKKLYAPGFPGTVVESERRAMLYARSVGLPAPLPGPIIQDESGVGFEMDFVEGPNGMQRIYAGGDFVLEAKSLAKLQAIIHSKPGGSLPGAHGRLCSAIQRAKELTPEERNEIQAIIEALPSGTSLLHGDLHPGNVIWSPDGPKIVDWVDASCGHPLAGVARSMVLFGEGLPVRSQEDESRAEFRKVYLKEYQRSTGRDLTVLQAWLTVCRAARLAEGVEDPEPLLVLIRKGI